MVTYTLKITDDGFAGPWVITATYGNHLQWEVGRYRDRRKAEDRIRRMEEISQAASLTD